MSDLKVVAKGNMSIVLADTAKKIAYKCIPHTSTCKTAFCGALKDEFQILSQIQHPSIIKIYNYHQQQQFFEKNNEKTNDEKDFEQNGKQPLQQPPGKKNNQQQIYESLINIIQQQEYYEIRPQICILEMEHLHCDYLDFLNKKPPILSKISIIKDIVDGVDYLHNTLKIPHNDLRLPNFLIKKIQSTEIQYQQQILSLNTQNTLKFEGEEFYLLKGVLADFGFAGKPASIFKRYTDTHLSPETQKLKQNLKNQNSYNDDKKQQQQFNEEEEKQQGNIDLFKNDVFQLGVSIFQSLFTGNLPFYNSSGVRHMDKYFQKFLNQDDTFWNIPVYKKTIKNLKQAVSKQFVEDLKDLIFQMLNPDYQKRFTIQQVKNHAIFKYLDTNQNQIQKQKL